MKAVRLAAVKRNFVKAGVEEVHFLWRTLLTECRQQNQQVRCGHSAVAIEVRWAPTAQSTEIRIRGDHAEDTAAIVPRGFLQIRAGLHIRAAWPVQQIAFAIVVKVTEAVSPTHTQGILFPLAIVDHVTNSISI